ncbi:MAG: EMC3/TMCO1 family protein [Candidatus Micrarchaeota archaeon]|nr:EMC3/TMCO1 family protein [Candidatus Micrarchaeota archaeon]
MMLDPFQAAIAITLAAGVYSGIFRYVVYEIGGMGKVIEMNKKMQEEMRAINKKYADAARARNDKALREIEGRMNTIAMDMLKMQVKPMLLTIPLLLVSGLIASSLMHIFPEFIIVLPLPLPVPQMSLDHLINWRDTFGPIGWFWISFMVSSLVAQFKIGGAKNEAKQKDKQ